MMILKIYDYVREYWSDWVEEPLSGDMDVDIETYFEEADGCETYTVVGPVSL